MQDDALHLDAMLARWRSAPAGTVEIPPSGREAAVAVVLAPMTDARPGVLLIERAQRPGDPWSGQIGLPGGKREPGDPDVIATARRETEEEVGVLLPERPEARFAPIQARRRGAITDLWVHPVVFRLDMAVPPGVSDEVASSRWVGVQDLVSRESASSLVVETGAGPRDFPALQLGSYLLWGLTYRILDDLLAHVGFRLPAGPMPLR